MQSMQAREASSLRPLGQEISSLAGGGAQAEVDARIRRRSMARAAEDVAALADAGSGEENLCPDAGT